MAVARTDGRPPPAVGGRGRDLRPEEQQYDQRRQDRERDQPEEMASGRPHVEYKTPPDGVSLRSRPMAATIIRP
ncbi:MAG: hypothetical protein ACT4OQ_06855 [Chloroflexota bacterium]